MIGLGVIGIGTFGINHLRAFKQLEYEGIAKLIAAADLNEELLKKRKEEFDIEVYTDYKKMLERDDIDGVSIATPDHLHKQIAIDCLKMEKHILVEKPLDVTVEGCEEIIKLAKEKDLFLEVDFHKRFDPYHIEMERLISREKKCGKILYGYSHMEDKIEVPRDWFPNWAPKSSPNWFLGVHMYDLVRWIMKSNGKRVYATGQKEKLVSLGIDTYDAIQVKVEFENGSSVFFDLSWILPDGYKAVVNQGIKLVGTNGILEVDSTNRGGYGCYGNENYRAYNLGFRRKVIDRKGRITYEGYGIESIQDFGRNIKYLIDDKGDIKDLEGKYPSGEDGLEVTKIAAAVEKSLKENKIITL